MYHTPGTVSFVNCYKTGVCTPFQTQKTQTIPDLRLGCTDTRNTYLTHVRGDHGHSNHFFLYPPPKEVPCLTQASPPFEVEPSARRGAADSKNFPELLTRGAQSIYHPNRDFEGLRSCNPTDQGALYALW